MALSEGTGSGIATSSHRDISCDDSFDWRLPLFALSGMFLTFLVLCLTMQWPSATLLFIFLLLPLSLLILAIVATFKRHGRQVAFLPTFVAALCLAFALQVYTQEIRTGIRWIVFGNCYRNALFAQPPPATGELRHVEWDDDAGLTDSNHLYLVLDPSDRLNAEMAMHSSGKFTGIPCTVRWISFKSHTWYIVRFGLNADWSICSRRTAG